MTAVTQHKGLRGPDWSPEEEELLTIHWPNIHKISVLTGRKFHAVRKRGYKLGFFRKKEWTYEEEILIMSGRPVRLLSGELKRTDLAIWDKIRKLKADDNFMWMLKADKACKTLTRRAFNWAIDNRIKGRLIIQQADEKNGLHSLR
ncbi:MAG: hypothetical protein QM762_12565 [Chryseolinea sp.]